MPADMRDVWGFMRFPTSGRDGDQRAVHLMVSLHGFQ
jgi:hypothetical protein